MNRGDKVSIKTTKYISRESAISMIFSSLPNLSNDLLGLLLDRIADSEESKCCSRFDNFIVSNAPSGRFNFGWDGSDEEPL